MLKGMYEKTVSLNHNESLMKVNKETGEMTAIQTRRNNLPEGKEIFEPDGVFRKDYTNSWSFLHKQLKPIEFKVAHILALMAKANTNTLEPLNDDTTIPQLIEILSVSKNVVKPILLKLWEFGVYGKFEVKEVDKPYTKYWVFNPYLSFSGRVINSDVSNLFKNTHCAKAFYNPNYEYRKS